MDSCWTYGNYTTLRMRPRVIRAVSWWYDWSPVFMRTMFATKHSISLVLSRNREKHTSGIVYESITVFSAAGRLSAKTNIYQPDFPEWYLYMSIYKKVIYNSLKITLVHNAQESSHTHKLWVSEVVGTPRAPRGAPTKKGYIFWHFAPGGFPASKLDSHARRPSHSYKVKGQSIV